MEEARGAIGIVCQKASADFQKKKKPLLSSKDRRQFLQNERLPFLQKVCLGPLPILDIEWRASWIQVKSSFKST